MTYRALASVLGALGIAVGCNPDGPREPAPTANSSDAGGAPEGPPVIENGFVSDLPSPKLPGGTPPTVDLASPDEVVMAKAIGDRVYVLSRYDGLTILDASDPAHLKFLARNRIDGVPFALDVSGGRVRVALNESHRWDGTQWLAGSVLLDIDATSTPESKELARFDLPGTIVGAHFRGTSLVIVTSEDGKCTGCSGAPGVVLRSFSGSGPALTNADTLALRGASPDYPFYDRTISISDQRVYLGGRVWDAAKPGTVVDVIDWSDPTGKFKRGAALIVPGYLGGTTASAIDDSGGVLRVVSALYDASTGAQNRLHVATFRSANYAQLPALGAADFDFSEDVGRVRLEGSRGYAIPGFLPSRVTLLDLSSPATPKRGGTIGSTVDDFEVLGDRVVVVDAADPFVNNGDLALYDISNMTAPRELSRVEFSNALSPVRRLRVFAGDGLISMPVVDGCDHHGLQLIDYTTSSLTLRGFAPTHGAPDETLRLSGGHFVGVAPREVTAFDITQRDMPMTLSAIVTSRGTGRIAPTSTFTATLASDSWSPDEVLTLAPLTALDDADVMGVVPIPTNFGCPWGPPERRPGIARTATRLFAHGDTVWVVRSRPDVTLFYPSAVDVLGFDASDPAAPRSVGKVSVPIVSPTTVDGTRTRSGAVVPAPRPCVVVSDGYDYTAIPGNNSGLGCEGQVLPAGADVLDLGTKLAFIERGDRWTPRILHVVDISNPASPVADPPVTLTPSDGTALLHGEGSTILTSRWVTSSEGTSRFYVDRIDVSGPAKLIDSVNVPGSLVVADASSSRYVTVEPGGTFRLVDVAGTKVTMRASYTPPGPADISGVLVAEGRIFLTRSTGGLLVLGGLRDGTLGLESSANGPALWPFAVDGSRIAVLQNSGIGVYDTSTPAAKLVSEIHEYGIDYRSNVRMSDHHAIFTFGDRGLRSTGW